MNSSDPSGLQLQPESFFLFSDYMFPADQRPGGGGGVCRNLVTGGEFPEKYVSCFLMLSGGSALPGADDGGGRPSNAALLAASKARIKADLAKPGCAKDFRDVDSVMHKVDEIGLSDQGAPRFHTENGQPVADGRSPGYGKYNPLFRSISLNSNSGVNWFDPSQMQGTFDGKPWTYDGLAGEAAFLGVSSITADQFMDIIVVHELGHYRGKGGFSNPDKAGVERTLWDDCIK